MLAMDLIKWLKDTPIDEVIEYASRLEGKIEEMRIDALNYIQEGDRDSAEEMLEEIKYYSKVYRMTRGYFDSLFFAYEYFSDDKNPENETNLIPKGVSIDDAPDFHRELTAKLDELTTINPIKNICWGSSRGSGKSAYLSNVYPTHAVVYRTRKYIVIISETASMSQNFVEFISTNLKSNAKLREDFGEHLSPNKKANPEDNQEGFVTFSEIKVQSSSMGGQLRGSRFKNARPDLICCDDLESAKNTNTKDLRDKNLHWFNSVVVPLGDPKKTAIIYMGTLVHGQGLLPNIMRRSGYDSKMYSAIISEPVHQDYWEKLENMLRDIDNPYRESEAEAFYAENREIMDEGVEVLWADRFSYFDLIKKKIEIGSRAFASEYLNKPSDDESVIFREDYFLYFEDSDLFVEDVKGRSRISHHLDIVGFWDIAMGKNSRSDYNAINIIARDRRTGAIYVLESWAKKCTPSQAMEVALNMVEKYQPKKFGVETIQAQYDIYRQMQSRAVQRGLYFTRIVPVNPTTRKESRIEALEPLFEQGVIRIKKNQRILQEQLLQYPNHDHDDSIDSLASAIGMTRVNKRGFWYKPEGI
ncbi:phage terminase large subunit [Bacillus sp. FSL K6-0993]|uniref:phage terminase large subunit n=1 Tax=Bacillus sp. FSL K6-0993 TaxID=2921456 RepID=UPI0030EE8A2F